MFDIIFSEIYLLRWLYIFIVFDAVLCAAHKKARKLKSPIPVYEEFKQKLIPSDVQVTTFLKKGEEKSFDYWSFTNGIQLTVIVTECSSRIRWTFTPKHNDTDLDVLHKSAIMSNDKTYKGKSQQGFYVLWLKGEDGDGYVHIYISTEKYGPEALRTKNRKFLQLRHIKKNKLSIKWESSLVDPHFTEYCITIDEKKHYETLCQAEAERYGFVKLGTYNRQPVAASQTLISFEEARSNYEILPAIACTGKKTHYYTSNLNPNGFYYVDLFAINRQNNFTYKIASNKTFFQASPRATSVKEGKLKFISLKDNDGFVNLKFKIGRSAHNSLEIYVMPCGGTVDVEVTHKHEIVESKRMIEGFGKLVIANPIHGARYYIKIFSTKKEELRRTSGVQIFLTTKIVPANPIPDLPKTSVIKEYLSLRTCDSITIAWLPSPGLKRAYYCIVVKEGKLRDGYTQVNQCGLENRMKKSFDFSLKFCKDIDQDKTKVLTQKINHLKPGRNYIVQVTIRKHRGNTISYDLLQAQTKPRCILQEK